MLRLPTPATIATDGLRVTVDALGYLPPHHDLQRAFVSVRGTPLAQWRLEGGGYGGLAVHVPRALLSPGAPTELVIDLPDAISPNAVLPGSGDPRRLGIGIRRITLAH